jgi:hypothetical protein
LTKQMMMDAFGIVSMLTHLETRHWNMEGWSEGTLGKSQGFSVL